MAKRITDFHCKVTGAPSRCATVLFLSGYPLKNNKKAMLMGSIGIDGTKTSEVIGCLKNELIRGLESSLKMKAPEVGLEFLDVESYWVYEGQRILLEPGKGYGQKNRVQGQENAMDVHFLP
ncbi:hypothetical protein L0P88_19730 [Muricauda sp. SCSIO 64092]|uniref:hypothetical protein n=1 Tax=Allomuricauda sp. SCSIO 64092 TaxID=2908842 RepID=UPI001FF2A14A|nr:hypothetical protein L0P88_19730 [Muricauda sp. SCSIO 64092]